MVQSKAYWVSSSIIFFDDLLFILASKYELNQLAAIDSAPQIKFCIFLYCTVYTEVALSNLKKYLLHYKTYKFIEWKKSGFFVFSTEKSIFRFIHRISEECSL